MRRLTVICLLCFALLYSHNSFGQPPDSAEKLKPPPVDNETEEPKPPPAREAAAEPPTRYESMGSPMDGLTLLMGVYSPFHDEMKGIYGSAFSFGLQYCLNMSRSVDLLASVGYMKKGGDPYYDEPTFSVPSSSSGKSPSIRIIPLEISIRQRIALMKDQSGSTSRGLYAGAGINYIRAKEESPEIPAATGGDFGAHIFAGPQIFFTDSIAFEGEVKLMLNNVDLEYEEKRYCVTLSGLFIRAGISWYY